MGKSDTSDHTPLFQTHFTPGEFSNRRAKVFDRIGSNALAILQSGRPPGYLEQFRQSNEFYYLCGVEVPHAHLLLDGRSRKTILYLPGHDPGRERSEGAILNSDDAELAQKLTGVDDVSKTDALPRDTTEAKVIYASHHNVIQNAASDPLDGQPTREAHFVDRIKALCRKAEIRDLSPIINELRVVKSPAEIELMGFAGQLTALAVTEAMRCTKPGIMEYQLGAIADYIYLVNGARGGAYPAIIGGGPNAWYGHYNRNDCELRDGDLVLMDYAPDYKYYTSDIGRMWPVNGKYAPWQRELYGFMVEYHKVLLKLIRPGAMASQIMDDAAKEMHQLIEKTAFSRPCYEQAARRTLEFRGHLSHTVGLAVHDGGNYSLKPLAPGTVFSVDPQMWIPEEKLYIRVEDTIVVTEDGTENLTQIAPLELDHVEAVMDEEGILQKTTGMVRFPRESR